MNIVKIKTLILSWEISGIYTIIGKQIIMILSITGVVKTILILIGVVVLLRFIGQLMIAKRNIAEQNELNKQKMNYEKQKEFVEKNNGKISISKSPSRAEDTDYEIIE